VPLNHTAFETLQQIRSTGNAAIPWVFPHKGGPHAGAPVFDIKEGFHAALDGADIAKFTWHDLRHTFASWLIMRGASPPQRRRVPGPHVAQDDHALRASLPRLPAGGSALARPSGRGERREHYGPPVTADRGSPSVEGQKGKKRATRSAAE
jgi:hypothetical protein